MLEVFTESIQIKTSGNDDMLDITSQINGVLTKRGADEGQVLISVIGSTAGLTTIEYEPGLKKDFPLAMEKIAPRNAHYHHSATWNDDNGHSHVRASLLGPSLTLPAKDGKLILGTWQQVVLIDFDTRPRHRKIVVQFVGKTKG